VPLCLVQFEELATYFDNLDFIVNIAINPARINDYNCHIVPLETSLHNPTAPVMVEA